MTADTVEQSADVKREARLLSRTLFGGAQYRVEVGAAIARSTDGVISIPPLTTELGLVAQSVSQEIRVLERAGLLRRQEKVGTERTVFFLRQESTYWAFCLEAQAYAGEMVRRGLPL
jgi:predicted transcriptional regulator